MLLPEIVISELVQSGQLWSAAPGHSGMRGDLATLDRAVSSRIAAVAAEFTVDDWVMPGVVALSALERAKYFESFPQWLTGVSHLSNDERVLERIARSASQAETARDSFESSSAALSPAVCYHTYAALSGTTLTDALIMTAEQTCWRNEREDMRPLERSWSFAMREIVCLGSTEEVERFRLRGIEAAVELADSLGLTTRVAIAADPFFAPTSRGRAMLQRMKSLKHELLIDYPDGRSLAIASFNNHECFFGDAFDITLGERGPASSACVAFGIERWVLAILMTHGIDVDLESLQLPATAGGTP